MTNLSNLREEYISAGLTKNQLNVDPFNQFENWVSFAIKAKIKEPNAMVLSTVDKLSRPSSRVVLLKFYDQNGFVFYTNFDSEKAQNISQNSNVSLCFNWLDLARQVRIQGTATKISTDMAQDYFSSRPRGSQLGAWVSEQSSLISNREVLEKRLAKYTKQFEGYLISKPENWGGFRVAPSSFEFWQGRTNRIHDRFRYSQIQENENKKWKIDRLAP